MKMKKMISRRDFVKASAMSATIAGISMPFNILKAGESPNNKLNVAFIGINHMGVYMLTYSKKTADKEINFRHFCDVDKIRLGGKLQPEWTMGPAKWGFTEQLKKVPITQDYRVMFDKYEKEIDAVVITTPDFSHYALGMTAMEYGKHVFIQKPLTNRIATTRALMKKAKEKGLVTQMGNQGRSQSGNWIIEKWYNEGIIGDIVDVHYIHGKRLPNTSVAYQNKPITKEEPLPGQEIPSNLDWDVWTNVAPKIPYNKAYQFGKWRPFRRFGSGGAGDWGCHKMDAAFHTLKLDYPISVLAETTSSSGTTEIYGSSKVTWEFKSKCQKTPVTFHWYFGNTASNCPIPEVLKGTDEKLKWNHLQSQIIVGTKNTVVAASYGGDPRIIPYTKMRDIRPSMEVDKVQYSGMHLLNFYKACKGEMKANSPFDYAGKLAETVLLGNLAGLRPGEKIMWDSEKMSTGDAEWDRWIYQADPRAGWIK